MTRKLFINLIAGLFLTIVIITWGVSPPIAKAVDFNLYAPTETLQRGQTVVFTIEIDTQGESLTSSQIGATYDSQYLEYLNTTPGESFSTITAEPLENNKLLITGSNPSGFSGQGTFAYLNFKLIAEAPGSTQLCTLWAPSPSPTQPSQINPTTPPQLTNAPQPTSLPKSGSTQTTTTAFLVGTAFMLGAISIFVFKKHYLPVSQFKKDQNKILAKKKHHQKQ